MLFLLVEKVTFNVIRLKISTGIWHYVSYSRIRGVRRYEIVVEHIIKPLLKKWWGTMLSNHQKVVEHVPPCPTYGDTPDVCIYFDTSIMINLIIINVTQQSKESLM